MSLHRDASALSSASQARPRESLDKRGLPSQGYLSEASQLRELAQKAAEDRTPIVFGRHRKKGKFRNVSAKLVANSPPDSKNTPQRVTGFQQPGSMRQRTPLKPDPVFISLTRRDIDYY